MIKTEVTKKSTEEVDAYSKEGCFCYGFIIEGCRWDTATNQLEESKPKEMFSVLPVVNCMAKDVPPPSDKEDKTFYSCPAYKTVDRFRTYVFHA